MTTKRKAKKIQKMRGQRSAGYGFTKGHRAAGQRGGKGMAGSDKHHRQKVMAATNGTYFGKHGFQRPQKLLDDISALNIGEVDSMADLLVERGLATLKGKRYQIDVSKLGIDKILGSGKVTKKMDLTGVESITERAREKITSAGGTLDLPVNE